MADEFSLIDTYFAPLSNQIGDDCAILELPAGKRLATSVDTMVQGVHFPADASQELVAYRAVAAALSDLAAMGAEPLAISLALTLLEADDAWLAPFASGIERALQEFRVALIGGDTTCGPLTITVQVFGALPTDQALSRSGAQAGDLVYVSGSPGTSCCMKCRHSWRTLRNSLPSSWWNAAWRISTPLSVPCCGWAPSS